MITTNDFNEYKEKVDLAKKAKEEFIKKEVGFLIDYVDEFILLSILSACSLSFLSLLTPLVQFIFLVASAIFLSISVWLGIVINEAEKIFEEKYQELCLLIVSDKEFKKNHK